MMRLLQPLRAVFFFFPLLLMLLLDVRLPDVELVLE